MKGFSLKPLVMVIVKTSMIYEYENDGHYELIKPISLPSSNHISA